MNIIILNNIHYIILIERTIMNFTKDKMDLITADKKLNHKWWKSGYCPKIHILEYELISRPRNISLDRCIHTKCHLTAEALWYCLTGKVLLDGLVYQETPILETLYINCDSDEHAFILHQGKIYDSCWNAYPLTIREAPPTMIQCIRQYQPFTLPRPDGMVHEVLEYECYGPDTDIIEDQIMVNYEALINHY